MKSFFAWIVLRYFRFFARIALLIHRPVVIGIAGSVGKSSTKQALFAILSSQGKTIMTKGNSETGIPFGILGIPVKGYSFADWFISALRAPFGIFHLFGVKYLIAEMGIDDPCPPKNMGYLLTIVEPDIAVFVTESAAHTEQFGKTLSETEKQLSAEKRIRLLIKRITHEDLKMAHTARCRTIIYNADNEYLAEAAKKISVADKELLTFGKDQANSLWYGDSEVTLEKTLFEFFISNDHVAVGIHGYALPLEYREVFGSALLVSRSLKFDLRSMADFLEKNLDLPKGRTSLFKGINNSVIIDSSYNASKQSVLAFLNLVYELKKKTGRPVVFAFGDMRELGSEAAIEHADVARHIPGIVDYLFCVGALTKKHVLPLVQKAGMRDVRWFQNSRALGSYLKDHMPEGAIVLVKGSQNTIFLEEAIKFILTNKEDEKKLCRQEGYWVKT